jgi:hypothetical protein
MMTTPDELAAHFRSLTDEELIRQSTKALTEEARALAEAEARSRGLKFPETVGHAVPGRDNSGATGDYVDIANLQDQAEAHLLKAYLESSGIPSVATGADVARAFGGVFGGTRLCVQKSFAKQARELVANYNDGVFQLDENADEYLAFQSDNSLTEGQEKGLKTYRVYAHPKRAASIVVKVGFSWAALVFGPLWFLVNRMWINSLFFISLVLGGRLHFQHFQPTNQTEDLMLLGMQFLYITAWILFSKFANSLLCSDLENKGYVLKATVKAKNPAYAREKATQI